MKMEVASLFRLEPALHLGTFVRAVVFHDQVNILIPEKFALQMINRMNSRLRCRSWDAKTRPGDDNTHWSAPKARVVALPIADDPFEHAAYVLEVLPTDAHVEHFLDQRQEICQRANRAQRRGIGGTHQAARSRQHAFSITFAETPRR